jgi:hypothetical protein
MIDSALKEVVGNAISTYPIIVSDFAVTTLSSKSDCPLS